MDRQLFPRLLAIAERGWSAKDVRDVADFTRRVAGQLPELKRLGVHYQGEPAAAIPKTARDRSAR